MAEIDNLKNRIIKDGMQKASEIEGEALKKVDNIIAEARKKAEKIVKDAKERAKEEGLKSSERIISGAELDKRNMILAAKQDLIDSVFKSAIQKIRSMKDDEYTALIEKLLLRNVESGDEEVIFAENDKHRIDSGLLKRVNEKLAGLNKQGKLTESRQTVGIESGFILKKGGVEVNCSIEALVWSLRESLETSIAAMLFGGK
ncbi:MAG: V-type ATP synthase subunit E [Clostridiales bacterium]|nr:V-type ATP synthase subunit E [Clostridiales bacterium]HBM80664.1 hypothetical protein [Clostridiaceae bacterium]